MFLNVLDSYSKSVQELEEALFGLEVELRQGLVAIAGYSYADFRCHLILDSKQIVQME
jgi:hypothetical protein